MTNKEAKEVLEELLDGTMEIKSRLGHDHFVFHFDAAEHVINAIRLAIQALGREEES